MRGYVARVVPDAGFGFITPEDGRELFFHRKALKGVNFEELAPTMEVVFEVKDQAEGDDPGEHARAVNVRLAEHEIPGVDNTALPSEKLG